MTGIAIVSKSKLLDPKSLRPNARNAAKHPPEQIAALAQSYRKFGFIGSVVTDSELTIIAGHGRVLAAIEAGMEKIPVIRADHLSPDELRALMHLDNELSRQKETDMEILNREVSELTAAGFDFAPFNFDIDALMAGVDPFPGEGLERKKDRPNAGESWDDDENEPDGDEDEECSAEEPTARLNPREIEVDEELNTLPEKPEARVKLGQVWALNDHRLICGDSTDPINIEKLFQKKTAEFCFTSPPYADQRTYNGGKELSTEKLAKFISVTADCVDLFAVNLGMSRKDFEVICYWDDYIEEAKKSGLKLLSWNIWSRTNSGYTVNQATAMFAIDHEWIFVFGKNAKRLNRTVPNKGAGKIEVSTKREVDGSTVPSTMKTQEFRQIGTILEVNQARNGGETSGHPAVFPVELPRVYIEACTNPGDTVYEPFGGSGTTLIACEQTNRTCLISELDPHYCDMIIARWEKISGNKASLIER